MVPPTLVSSANARRAGTRAAPQSVRTTSLHRRSVFPVVSATRGRAWHHLFVRADAVSLYLGPQGTLANLQAKLPALEAAKFELLVLSADSVDGAGPPARLKATLLSLVCISRRQTRQ